MAEENRLKDFADFLERFNTNKNLSAEELLEQQIVKEIGFFYGLSEAGMKQAVETYFMTK